MGPTTYFIDSGWDILLQGGINHGDHSMDDFLASLNIHSYHLLLFLNLSPLCVHLLFRHDAERKLSGLIFSKRKGLPYSCCIQLQKLWDMFGKCLAVSVEERNLLVEQALLQHYEVGYTIQMSVYSKKKLYLLIKKVF